MNELENLLKISEIERENANGTFREIAETLMCNYIIKKGGKRYAIVEIEFYLYTHKHQDFITYPRKTEAGRWFFHQSGVDLTFNTSGLLVEKINEKGKKCLDYSKCVFGGILIRGIYDIDADEYIFGPQNVVNELWDDFDAFNPSLDQYPFIKKEPASVSAHLFQCPRHINIQGYDNQISKIKEWITKRLGIDNIQDIDIPVYRTKLFEDTYRFFNLQNEEKPWNFIKIPANIRPKEEETKEVK